MQTVPIVQIIKNILILVFTNLFDSNIGLFLLLMILFLNLYFPTLLFLSLFYTGPNTRVFVLCSLFCICTTKTQLWLSFCFFYVPLSFISYNSFVIYSLSTFVPFGPITSFSVMDIVFFKVSQSCSIYFPTS